MRISYQVKCSISQWEYHTKSNVAFHSENYIWLGMIFSLWNATFDLVWYSHCEMLHLTWYDILTVKCYIWLGMIFSLWNATFDSVWYSHCEMLHLTWYDILTVKCYIWLGMIFSLWNVSYQVKCGGSAGMLCYHWTWTTYHYWRDQEFCCVPDNWECLVISPWAEAEGSANIHVNGWKETKLMFRSDPVKTMTWTQ